MGGCSSKDISSVKSNRHRPSSSIHEYGYGDDIIVESINKYDEQFINAAKRDLQENPQLFVLNNLLMATQFFENYQKDILKLAHSTTTKMEKELNLMLLKDETMEFTSPDIVFDKVNKNILYRPFHGSNKHKSEPIASKRLYVINDTIEVVDTMDIPQYTSIDKPAYQVRIEESSRKGYVRLKQIDTNKFPRQKTYTTPPSEPTPGPSTSSDEVYDYTTIYDIKTPKSLHITEKVERRDTLPDTCFTTRKIKKKVDLLIDSDNEDDDPDVTEDDFFERVTYIDSKGFMNYFKNAVFPNSLGRALGFDELAIAEAKAIPGKIFCNLTDADDNPIPCEVVPSVAIEWPAEQTFEFIMREDRPTITDNRTGFRYRWPTDDMIKEIKSMSCVLVPKGYWFKKGKYADSNIEWEIAFPKAERYIETRMSHTQMRCFLFLLAIHKTYIDPKTRLHGLLVEHIRCHMYWECEANYRDWPEHMLGTKVLKVITNLNRRLAKGVLPDYFIKQKNLFENIPKKYLMFAQKVFHDILQSPAMYFVKALRRIRYTSGKFYPALNYKELYKILTQLQAIKLINPSLSSVPPNLKKKRYQDAETQWRHIQELKNKERILKRKRGEENLNTEIIEERRESEDSIDLDWICEKNFDIFKIKAILQLFINNFIDTARISSRMGTKDQPLFYLKQASYLTKILEDTAAGFIVEVNDFKEIIAAEEESCLKIAAKEISDLPPTTPVRNSVQFDFSVHQQLKNNLVNLNNLNNSYHRSGIPPLQTSPSLNSKKLDRIEKVKLIETNGDLPRKSVAFIEPKR